MKRAILDILGQPERYRIPPKNAFRAMGLGVEREGCVKVVAGFRFRWWTPEGIQPLFVEARILRRKHGAIAKADGSAARREK
jgi:hypothetical protein